MDRTVERHGFTVARLHECFKLNAETGDLHWRTRPRHHFRTTAGHARFNNLYAGKRADISTYPTKGYRRVRLTTIEGKKVTISAHLIVYAMTNGVWPTLEVDHRDRAKTNNAPGNLRDVTHGVNMLNTHRGSARL